MPWLSDLRPLWWAVRGFALAALPAIVLGAGIVWLGTVGAVASVVIGLLARNGKLTGGWVRPTRVIGNIAAVLLLPFAFILLVDGGDPYANDVYAEPQGDAGLGLINNDGPVMNLYAYDESGRRIDKVRLFDQNGQALTVSEEVFYGSDVDHLRHPNTGEVGVARDVFPVRWDVRTGWERMSKVEWEPPVAITPLPGPVPSVEPTDSASASPSPSASVTRSPVSPQTSPSSGVSATPTPTPSASPSASR